MRNVARRVRASLVIVFLFVLSVSFADPAKLQIGGTPFKVDLTQMAPPDTTSLPSSTPVSPALYVPPNDPFVYDSFAWQTFIAMNWPAIEPSWLNLWLRGWPDARDPENVNFVCAGVHDGPLVWETFKEKREVFDQDAKTEEEARPFPWSFPFYYKVDGFDPKASSHPSKLLTHGINFLPTIDGKKFVSLDETVEVASQARELNTKVPFPKSTPVFPRVYRGTTRDLGTPGNAVRYEVKVNYDFFKYVVDNKLYFDENTYARSLKQPPVQLPWRTSVPDPGVTFYTQKPARTNYTSGYSAQKTQERYRGLHFPGEPPPEIGAIHIKAAWVPIADNDPNKDTFLLRRSTYFGNDGQPHETLFGLVGLHIIQRIKVRPTGTPVPVLNNLPVGGTFIYATWEHTEIEPPATTPAPNLQKYTYENFYLDQGVQSEGVLYPLQRLYKILGHTQTANETLWNQIKDVQCGAQKAKPVWLYYRLVGVQFLPYNITDDASDQQIDAPNQTDPGETKGFGMPLYLANLYIETNKGLQHFQGLPPATFPTNQFPDTTSPLSHTNPGGTFNHKIGNVEFGFKPYNMGGCMGCHGVAQMEGYSFSFVLLGGQAGAGVDAESRYSPPVNPNRPLLSGGMITVQNPATSNDFLENNNGQAAYGVAAGIYTIMGVDVPVGERLSFKDKVYLIQRLLTKPSSTKSPKTPKSPPPTTQYLTATNTSQNNGQIKTVVFQPTVSPAAVWILYNANDPNSTEDITNPSAVSFQNASITFPGNVPAFLTTYPQNGNVNTVNHASPAATSSEVWSLIRVR